MKVLIKLGGALLDHPEKLCALAGQLALAASVHRIVVVHGGGKQVTGFLEERGVTSRFVGGLRVSDATVMDAVVKVIAGTVNTQLVASLVSAGINAVGLSGIDGQLTRAEQLRPELEQVGRPVASNGALLDLLLHADYLPVVACIAGGIDGQIFNVNADAMAVSCAKGWRAERLIFFTDVSGVKGADGAVLPQLTFAQVSELIRSGVAHGGMQAKLEAASDALREGLHVTVAAGTEPDAISRLLRGERLGTELFPA